MRCASEPVVDFQLSTSEQLLLRQKRAAGPRSAAQINLTTILDAGLRVCWTTHPLTDTNGTLPQRCATPQTARRPRTARSLEETVDDLHCARTVRLADLEPTGAGGRPAIAAGLGWILRFARHLTPRGPALRAGVNMVCVHLLDLCETCTGCWLLNWATLPALAVGAISRGASVSHR